MKALMVSSGRMCNTLWFMGLDDASQKMEDWPRDYNETPTLLDWRQTTDLVFKTHGGVSVTVTPNPGNPSSRVNLTWVTSQLIEIITSQMD